MPPTQLNELVEQITARQEQNLDAAGFSVLFAGASGTGKTMTACSLARRLGTSMHLVDSSQVVSKYIGETEKNLARVFAAAEVTGAILFFDEADALFGKRTEVKDSHDRYANVATSYLLRRMESFGGMAILATIEKKSLDEAFVRCLQFILNFPRSGTEERTSTGQSGLLLNPSDPLDLTFALKKAVKRAGMSLDELAKSLKQIYGVELTASGLSHAINRESIQLQRALQILAICGVAKVEIREAQ